MIGFENFDLRAWLVEGLTRHVPQSIEVPQSLEENRPAHVRKSRVVLSAAAVAAVGGVFYFGLTAGVTSQIGSRVADMHGMGSSAFHNSSEENSDAFPPSEDPVADFLARSQQVISDLRNRTLHASSEETLGIASAALGRIAPVSASATPDWVTKLVSEISQLRD